MKKGRSSWRRTPWATYRLQFNRHFAFHRAIAIIPYLQELGISDCYASPLFQARRESLHGYDVCDFARLNPVLGSEADFDQFTATLAQAGMGLLLDIVPNHMGTDLTNPWWLEVLENGPSSPYAEWFDIDWHAPGLEGKVLLPVLEDHYTKVLEGGKLSLAFRSGRLVVAYYDKHFPLSQDSYGQVLGEALLLAQTRSRPAQVIEQLQQLRNACAPAQAKSGDSAAEFVKLKQDLERYLRSKAEFREDVSNAIDAFNRPEATESAFDKLDALLQKQHFRLAYWRLAPEKINYRRFFDITELVSLRMELSQVFAATHQFVLQLIQQGKVTGLRIDHPDGLWSPKQYLERLQRAVQSSGSPLYTVVEKILTNEEALPEDWPVAGTTGYDFLNQVNGLFVNKENSGAFDALYHEFTGSETDFAGVVFASKKRMLLSSFLAELSALTRRLEALAARTGGGQGFAYERIREVLIEVLTRVPVYRTYIDDQTTKVQSAERTYILEAIRSAVISNPGLDADIVRFLQSVLLLEPLPGLPEQSRKEFIMRFQQLTSPLMAKGLEDTAFYNFNPLISLNEVGGNPGRFGTEVQSFHDYNQAKCEHWPDSLLATATHDTKRGEDARARINVLSEMPEEWQKALLRWRNTNQRHKTLVQGQPAPRPNDEYLFYQSLLGAWVPEAEHADGLAQLRQRMIAYMLKAIRESKAHTSWTDPNPPYEEAVRRFVEQVLSERLDNPFLVNFKPFQRRIAFFGRLNSLSQTLLKMTAPGVPDFYQGTELWDFNLVDPDNRRPVNFEECRRLLSNLKHRLNQHTSDRGPFLEALLRDSAAGQLKLFLIWQTLQVRGSHWLLFAESSYTGLSSTGAKARHVCAFGRLATEAAIIAIAPRLVLGLTNGQERLPLGPEVWQDTLLEIPSSGKEDEYRNILTQQRHFAKPSKPGLPLADLLSQFPVALLMRVS